MSFEIRVFDKQEGFRVEVWVQPANIKTATFPYEGGEFRWSDESYLLRGPAQGLAEYTLYQICPVSCPVINATDVTDLEELRKHTALLKRQLKSAITASTLGRMMSENLPQLLKLVEAADNEIVALRREKELQ